MTKYTKRQYLADVAANEAAITTNNELLGSFHDRLSDGEKIETLSDDWNAAHDRDWDLHAERNDIETKWRRRNWTWQDHSEHSLVMQNID